MSTPVIFQITCNSFICLLARTQVTFTMHVHVHEMKLDFVEDLFSKAYAGDCSIQDAPLKVEREYLFRF
jgi:hypothetical protein